MDLPDGETEATSPIIDNRKLRREERMGEMTRESGDLIWKIEESRLTYSYPLQVGRNISEEGIIIAEGIPTDQLYYVGPFLAAKRPQTHTGPSLCAIDFLVPDGTVVLSGQNGKIVEVQEDFDRWGVAPEFGRYLNSLTIQHENDEFSQYCHIARLSVTKHGLRTGDWVKTGQAIAVVGKTGRTDRDHLHFVVFRTDKRAQNPNRIKSLQVRFASTE